MSTGELFKKYKTRLLLEAAYKSALYGAAIGAIGVFITSIVYHILIKETDLKIVLIVFGALFALTFALMFGIVFFPTKKRIAARVDEVGLQERATTMYEYESDPSKMAQLQREDATEHIKKVKTSNLTSHVQIKEILISSICLLVCLGMLLVPYDLFAFNSDAETDPEELRQQEIIKELIEKLREEVNRNENDPDVAKELNDMIDDLERELSEKKSELERAAKIREAEDRVDEIVDKEVSKDEIGEALQRSELTKELGEAISEGNKKKAEKALDDLDEKLKEEKELIEQLQKDIADALEESDAKKDDDIRKALEEYSEKLSEAKEKEDSEKSVKKISEATDEAKEKIAAALEKQEKTEEEGEKLRELLEDAKKELLEGEKEEPGEGEGEDPGEGEGEGQKPGEGEGEGEEPGEGEGQGQEPGEGEGKEPGNEGEGGNQGGQGGGQQDTMTEGIFDPESGKVQYGEVFATYYAQYLEAVKNGNVTEEMRNFMDQYFNSLMK